MPRKDWHTENATMGNTARGILRIDGDDVRTHQGFINLNSIKFGNDREMLGDDVSTIDHRTTIKLEDKEFDDDGISDSETRSLYYTGAADNRGIIRQSLRELFANPLKSNELGVTLEFARQIDRLAKFGGRECPLNFLSEARLRALRQYVNEKLWQRHHTQATLWRFASFRRDVH